MLRSTHCSCVAQPPAQHQHTITVGGVWGTQEEQGPRHTLSEGPCLTGTQIGEEGRGRERESKQELQTHYVPFLFPAVVQLWVV